MTKIFIARHPTEAHLVKNLLESEGVTAEVHGEALYSALGEIPIISDTLPSVWIWDDSLADKAKEVIDRYLKGQNSDVSFGKPWHCPGCGEFIESQFTSCWRCGTYSEKYGTGKTDKKSFRNTDKVLTDDQRRHAINKNVLFRYLVVTSFMLYTIWFFMPYFWNFLYDQKIQILMSWNGYGGLIMNNAWIAYSFFLLYLITYCGLIYFRTWARVVFVALMIGSFINTSIGGVVVRTAFEYLLESLIFTIDGSIVIMMYFTDVKIIFRKDFQEPMLEREGDVHNQ